MRICNGIGIDMVTTMVGGPPQRTALHTGGADAGEHQLHRAGGAEGAMGEVTVIKAGDREHAQQVQAAGDRKGQP